MKELPKRVDGIKNMLINEYGLDEEYVKGLTKIEASSLLEQHIKSPESTEELTIELEYEGVGNEEEDEDKEKIPDYHSPEWSDWILSQLDDNEKDERGNPKIEGLRRISHYILGFYSSACEVVDAPHRENGYRATVTVTISHDPSTFIPAGRIITCGADAYGGNSSDVFAKHLVGTAESRAESRALRKALNVRVMTSEELGQEDLAPEETLTAIRLKCQQAGIDPIDILAKEFSDKGSLEELSRSEALRFIHLISTAEREELKIEEIDDE